MIFSVILQRYVRLPVFRFFSGFYRERKTVTIADVCNVLGIGNSAMAADRLDEDEKGISTIDTPSGLQKLIIIRNEKRVQKIEKARPDA